MAAQVLRPEQLDLMDYLLWDWRRRNPDMVRVSFVRFSNFAIGRGKSANAEVLAAGGFLAARLAPGALPETRTLLGVFAPQSPIAAVVIVAASTGWVGDRPPSLQWTITGVAALALLWLVFSLWAAGQAMAVRRLCGPWWTLRGLAGSSARCRTPRSTRTADNPYPRVDPAHPLGPNPQR
jgi:hypothetical protein